MGQAKAKQRQAALAAVGARGTAAPPPPAAADHAAPETKGLTPETANRLHELFCRWQGSENHAAADKAAWAKALLETCQTLALTVPRTEQGSYDLSAVEVDFLGHEVTVRPPAPASAPAPPASVPSAPQEPAAEAEAEAEPESEDAADGG